MEETSKEQNVDQDKEFVFEEVEGIDNASLSVMQRMNFMRAVVEIEDNTFPFDFDCGGELVTRAEYIRRRVLGLFSSGGKIIGDALTEWGYAIMTQQQKDDRENKMHCGNPRS